MHMQEMTEEERSMIKDFDKCDFSEINQHFKEKSEARKRISQEEKEILIVHNNKIVDEYGWATVDGHRRKIINFRLEPPGLFRGRGNHPKQGNIKVKHFSWINCSFYHFVRARTHNTQHTHTHKGNCGTIVCLFLSFIVEAYSS